MRLPAPKLLPEGAVLLRPGIFVLHKDAVMLALDLPELVPDEIEEIFVGGLNGPVGAKFDDTHRPVDALNEGGLGHS